MAGRRILSSTLDVPDGYEPESLALQTDVASGHNNSLTGGFSSAILSMLRDGGADAFPSFPTFNQGGMPVTQNFHPDGPDAVGGVALYSARPPSTFLSFATTSAAEVPFPNVVEGNKAADRVSAETQHFSPGRETADRAVAIQEKNRRAQKRFRERQKERMKSMEDESEALSVKVKELTEHNHNLQTRNSILEKVLALRDEQVQLVQERLQVFGSSDEFSLINYLRSKSATLPCGLPMEVLPRDQAFIMSVKNRTVDEIMAQWKAYVKELADLLNVYESGVGQAEVTEKITRVVGQVADLCMMTALFAPMNMRKLLCYPANERHVAMMGDPVAFWDPVLLSLQLTDLQVKEVVRLRSVFLERGAQLQGERKRLAADLQQAVAADVDTNLRGPVKELLQVHEVMNDFRRNLTEEHATVVEFFGTMFKQVFTPMQRARALVHSYPCYPDGLALATAIARRSSGTLLCIK